MPVAPSKLWPHGRSRNAALGVVELGHADLFVGRRPRVHHAPKMQRQERRRRELHRHLGERGLHELERADRLAELHAVLRVLEGCLETGARGTHGAPGDAEARFGETRERALHPLHPGEHRVGGQPNLAQEQLRPGGRPERPRVLQLTELDPRRVRGDDESTDDRRFVLGPYDRDVTRPTRSCSTSCARSGSSPNRHAGPSSSSLAGIRAGVGFGEREAADRVAGGHARAAIPASVPRSRTRGSGTSPATPAR